MVFGESMCAWINVCLVKDQCVFGKGSMCVR